MKIILLFLTFVFSVTAQVQKKPKILIIVSDDHAYQSINILGAPVQASPNIDRIAREGAIFANSYVTSSICGPSRAMLLTGKYSHKNGFKDNKNSNFNGSQDSFIKELQAAG